MTTRDSRLGARSYKRLREAVLDRDLWLCQIKGPGCTKAATTVDHIIARADGGDVYNPANLRAACVHCNGVASARRTHQLRQRWGYRNAMARYQSRF
jgi:5-methylcytosine-specific restriction enzyme A